MEKLKLLAGATQTLEKVVSYPCLPIAISVFVFVFGH